MRHIYYLIVVLSSVTSHRGVTSLFDFELDLWKKIPTKTVKKFKAGRFPWKSDVSPANIDSEYKYSTAKISNFKVNDP